MKLKIKLIIMNFLQYFIWGAWLISLGSYLGGALGFSGVQIGSFYAIMGITSLFMPAVMGIIADRWIPAEKLLGISHLLGGFFIFMASTTTDYNLLYAYIFLGVGFYMPTIALSNSVAYNALEKYGYDTIKDFPPIRVFGTIGFIAAMWTVDLTGFKQSEVQFYVSAIASLILGVYSFTLPHCPVSKSNEKRSFVEALGLKAFTLFKDKKMAIFFI